MKPTPEEFIKQAEIEEALAESLDFEWGGCPDNAVRCRIRAKALRELADGWQNPNAIERGEYRGVK